MIEAHDARVLGRRNQALFVAFVLSGFSGLLYQVVWLRLAFAQFGVITPVLSVVIAVFMLGLGLGSWLGGRWVQSLSRRLRISPLLLYALVEGLIGIWGLVVPTLLDLGAASLLQAGESSSVQYLLQSAVVIALALLPGCLLMGTTFPFVVGYFQSWPESQKNSFSFLYLANVIGAMCGALFTALIVIELFGFRGALLLGAGFNWMAAGIGLRMGLRYPAPLAVERLSGTAERKPALSSEKTALYTLFLTGFASMGMEVAWTRAFTPIVRTTIYAFAFLLTSYLLATWLGSYVYRRQLRSNAVISDERLVFLLSLAAFAPLFFNDPRIDPTAVHVLLSLFPICAVLGYLTPRLIDRYSMGEAGRVGFAYAVNVTGCILGPLVSGYLLLPSIGVKWTLVVLSLPFAALTLFFVVRGALPMTAAIGLVSIGVFAVSFPRTYEDAVPRGPTFQVRRDHSATVTSYGEGMEKGLLVNGVGITNLTPITKVMAHLPLLSLPRPPENSLVICLGMGTTFRSLLSWGIDATAVELVPSVRDAFGYYFSDAAALLADPRARIVVDDGRRFLRRTSRYFDVITLDPPPPVEAAGSSLLYSVEFYRDAKARLKPGGILQQWFPGGEERILQSITASLVSSFQHVRVFRSVEDWGFHFLASDQPIRTLSPAESLQLLPPAARDDLMEWYPGREPLEVLEGILAREVPLSTILPRDGVITLTDDRPVNEYFFVRRLGLGVWGRGHGQ